ncbi:MAG: hypothetical protein QME46_01465 [Thermoanaerobacteraceae bacterium]|nr:hypothetical protein [Thermoanaerobacteraceae bacterium]
MINCHKNKESSRRKESFDIRLRDMTRKSFYAAFIFIMCLVISTPLSTVNAASSTNDEVYTYVWMYPEGGVLVPFAQVIRVNVGYNYNTSGGTMTVSKSILGGTAEEGANMPFEEQIYLINIEWEKNGDLYSNLNSFSYPSIIYDPDDVVEYGENNKTLYFDLEYDTWKQTGNIEVYAPDTSNIFHFFDVTNY